MSIPLCFAPLQINSRSFITGLVLCNVVSNVCKEGSSSMIVSKYSVDVNDGISEKRWLLSRDSLLLSSLLSIQLYRR